MRVNALFRCRLCGGTAKREILKNAALNTMRQIQYPGIVTVAPEHRQPIAIKHRCRERFYGVADFIGYEEIAEPEEQGKTS